MSPPRQYRTVINSLNTTPMGPAPYGFRSYANPPIRVPVHYYSVCEIVPSALVLFILRKLPPRSAPALQHQYHTIS